MHGTLVPKDSKVRRSTDAMPELPFPSRLPVLIHDVNRSVPEDFSVNEEPHVYGQVAEEDALLLCARLSPLRLLPRGENGRIQWVIVLWGGSPLRLLDSSFLF